MKVVGGTPEEAGRYIIQIAGCNDCHTPGAMMGPVAEAEWLTGVPVGWRGPWGTTYASNLRLYVQQFGEDTWVKVMRERKARPPMPWSAMNAMSDEDLRAVYRYIKSLGPKGQAMPAFVPAGQEPKTPYLLMQPQGLPSAAAK
jgi:mono/diheme cytochrome c family protein